MLKTTVLILSCTMACSTLVMLLWLCLSSKTSCRKELHNANYSGHVGDHRKHYHVQRWPGLLTDVRKYVQGCATCQHDKASRHHPAAKLMPLGVPKEHGSCHHGSDNTVGKTKITQLSVVIDKFTRITHLAPKSTAADIVQAFVEHIWKLHRMPSILTSDRGIGFTNKLAAT